MHLFRNTGEVFKTAASGSTITLLPFGILTTVKIFQSFVSIIQNKYLRECGMKEKIRIKRKNYIGEGTKPMVCQLNYGGQDDELPYFTFEGLDKTGCVAHCFTTRKGGVSSGYLESLNFSINRGDTTENIAENYRRVAALFGKTDRKSVV